jgi:hypothetical protein
MWRNPGVRAVFLLKMLVGFAIAHEGLAAPYAAELGAATFAVGLILASDPVGSVVGAWVYTRWVPTDLKRTLVGPLAVGSVFPLVFQAVGPALAISMTLIAFSGALAAPVPAAVAWNRATAAQPDVWRSGTGNLGDVSLRGRTLVPPFVAPYVCSESRSCHSSWFAGYPELCHGVGRSP